MKLFTFIYFVFFATSVYAQGVIISENENDNVDGSAILELRSTNKGLLIPRMNSTANVNNPQPGLVVYQTGGTPGFYIYDGAWKLLGESGGGGVIDGLNNNFTPYWNGTELVDGSIQQNINLGNAIREVLISSNTENTDFRIQSNTRTALELESNGNLWTFQHENGGLALIRTDGGNPTFEAFQVRPGDNFLALSRVSIGTAANNPEALYVEGNILSRGSISATDATGIKKLSMTIDSQGAGAFGVTGNNGNANVILGTSGNPNNGQLLIYDENEDPRIQAVIDGAGNGIIKANSIAARDINKVDKANMSVVANGSGRLELFGSTPNKPNFYIGDDSGTADEGAMYIYNQAGEDKFGFTIDGAGDGNLRIDGSITATNITEGSDKRIKKNIEPYNDGLSTLLQINPVWYEYNGLAGFTDNGQKHVGIIAQDIEPILPYTLKKTAMKLNKQDEEETEIFTYDDSALSYLLINAVKEQQVEIEALKNALEEQKEINSNIKQEKATLEASLESLEKRIQQIEQLMKQ